MRANKDIIVLAVETSCDETSCAVVRNGREVLSNVISTQIDMHRTFGGVVPEIASRLHVEMLIPVIDKAIKDANIGLEDVDLVATTYGPGLVGALLVGISGAKALSMSLNKPFLGVNHVEGHIYSNILIHEDLEFPFVCLTVSGGHTELVLVKDHGDYEVLGRTRDDAAGEAFDKVGRVLGLPYPAGPAIDAMCSEVDDRSYAFPKAVVEGRPFDFSFSGLKTAAINKISNMKQKGEEFDIASFLASFQRAIVEELSDRVVKVIEQTGIKNVAISGGVAANSKLRSILTVQCENRGARLFYPDRKMCTDNAAMIASIAYYRFSKGETSNMSLNAKPNAKLF